MARIETLAQLRAVLGSPSEATTRKVHHRLNERARAFIARSPMVLVATADAAGRSTVSPKGDAAGSVRVLDDRTLLLPERPGNRLAFSFQNLLENPRIGLVFLVPGTPETLRVDGEGELRDDADLCAALTSRGRPALLVTRIRVEKAYFHCAKAFLRAGVWRPETWPPPVEISFGEEIAEEGGIDRSGVAALDAAVRRRYETDL